MPSEISEYIIEQFRSRRVLLWLCQRYELKPDQKRHELGEDANELQTRYREDLNPLDEKIASIHWEAIWTDSVRGIIAEAVRKQHRNNTGNGSRPPVILAADPDEHGQLDTRELLPLYLPFGLLNPKQAENRYSCSRLKRQNYQLNILRKIRDYPNRMLVILGAAENTDYEMILEAVSAFTPLNFRVLIIWPENAEKPEIPSEVPVDIWNGSIEDFLKKLERLKVPRADSTSEYELRVKGGVLTIDDADLFGITDRFTLILEKDLHPPDPDQVTRDVFEDFLKGTEKDWIGYAAGLAFPRNYQALPNRKIRLTGFILEELKKLESSQGRSFNLSVTLPARNGSGVTTLLRLTAFEVASKGYPVLLLKQDQIGFDIDTLNAFLNRLEQKCISQLEMSSSPPVLLVFDVDHEDIREICYAAQTLSALGRQVVVLCAVTDDISLAEEQNIPAKLRVRGQNKKLELLSGNVGNEELRELQSHFVNISQEYPLCLETPSLSEWTEYQRTQAFLNRYDRREEGESLFWVALHFFLFNRDIAPPSRFHDWIEKVYNDLTDDAVKEAVKRIAALSFFRLVTPLTPLLRSLGKSESVSYEMIEALADLDSKSGLISWKGRTEDLYDQVIRFRHPLLAEILLFQITDFATAKFPIEIVWPLIETLRGGREADIWLSQSIVFNILKTKKGGYDSHIVKKLKTFQRIPPEISDYSKVILHHWGRALYHSISGKSDGVQGILLQAIEKLKRAINLPSRFGRDEHPSHLYNTLGSIYFEFYKQQEKSGQNTVGDSIWADCFEKSLTFLADNYQALLAYGHRLVERASGFTDNSAEAFDYALRALSYFDQAEDIVEYGELSEADKYYIDSQRNRAWTIMDSEQAEHEIAELIEQKKESGYLIKARQKIADLDLTDSDNLSAKEEHAVKGAIDILERAEEEIGMPSWRTFYLLYQLYIVHPDFRFDFGKQLKLMEKLKITEDFKWHIRMRFRYAVLLYQNNEFRKGARAFRDIRAFVGRPDQPFIHLSDFWRHQNQPEEAKKTSFKVRRIESKSKGFAFVEDIGQDVLFQPIHFKPQPKVGGHKYCIIRFETNGPIAVPPWFPKR